MVCESGKVVLVPGEESGQWPDEQPGLSSGRHLIAAKGLMSASTKHIPKRVRPQRGALPL